jgi:enoyl-CoA hydratase
VSEPAYQNLRLVVNDRVAVVTVSRPEKRNALNGQTMDELGEVFARLRDDPEVGGVILTGAGDKAFVAGADIGELATDAPLGGKGRSQRGQRVLDSIEQLGKPVVAAVNGFALGGGLELALACHLRLASTNARFATPEVKLGLLCGYGGTQRLPRLVGKGRALELLLSGEMIGAEEAHRIGLVNRVCAPETLLRDAEALLRVILGSAPVALRLTLEAVDAGLDTTLARGLEHEATLFGVLCATEDKKEGTQAFLEKRPPKFTGR